MSPPTVPNAIKIVRKRESPSIVDTDLAGYMNITGIYTLDIFHI